MTDCKTVRKAIDMTQREFADYTMTSIRTISRIECGESEASGPFKKLLEYIEKYGQIKA